jgi:hypothetical protein
MSIALSQTTNWYATFGDIRLKDLKYYLRNCSLPSIMHAQTEVPHKIHNRGIVGSDLEYGELILEVLVDEDFENYLALFDVITSYKDTYTGIIRNEPFNMDLWITSNKGNIFLKFNYEECYIVSLEENIFSDANPESDPLTIRLGIKFNHVSYERIKK